MKISRYVGVVAILATHLVSRAAGQGPVLEGTIVEGVVTRLGTNEPLSDVEVTLEGGTLDPRATQAILEFAASRGLVVTSPPNASLPEVIQAIVAASSSRGLPVTEATIQNLVNSAVGKQDWPTLSSGRDGRFVFRNLRAGRYTLRATREGYFGEPSQGVYPSNASVNIVVQGNEAQQVSLAMVQGATISGRIYDPVGLPLPNVTVQALSVGYQGGFPLLQPTVQKTTDDRGDYRLFWLPPGDYYLDVMPRTASPVSGGMPGARTFYPGVTQMQNASPIRIRGGEELPGMNVGVRTAPRFKISGQVSSLLAMPADDGGPGLVTAFLHLANRDLTAPDDSTAANGAGRLSLTPSTGTFELDGVAPGSYELLARVADPAAGTGLAGFSWGRTSVDIVDQDINGVSIAVNSSVVLRGTVRSDSGANPGPGLRVGLIPMGGSARIALYQLISTRPAAVGPDGSFAIMAVPPGSFRVGAVSGLPADSYIADVRQNARSVFDSGFDVGSQTPDPIEIVISSGAAAVDGFVRDALSGSASGATVALVPGRGRIENRALYHSTISDRSGHFTFRGVAPGEYQLFAWADAPRNADQSPSFFRMYEGQGRVVHLDRNAAVNMDITVIK